MTGMGHLVCEMGVHVQGMVGASIVGVHALGATSLSNRVTVHLGGVKSELVGAVGVV